MAQQHELGKQGEEIATRFLVNKGYTILARNWRHHHLEIDIIARDGDELVIVEVKSRGSAAYEHPSEAVSNRKIRFLVKAAEAYIQETESDLDTRFDVISIIFHGPDHELEHFEDAFYPTM